MWVSEDISVMPVLTADMARRFKSETHTLPATMNTPIFIVTRWFNVYQLKRAILGPVLANTPTSTLSAT